jgi:hypothetical protein
MGYSDITSSFKSPSFKSSLGTSSFKSSLGSSSFGSSSFNSSSFGNGALDVFKDKFFLLFLVVASSGYVINVILFNEMKKCKSKKETQTILFKFEAFIQFMIYSCFIYFLSSYSDITFDITNKIIFVVVTLVALVLMNVLNVNFQKLLSKIMNPKDLIQNTNISNISDVTNISNLTNIAKLVGGSLIIILIGGYNIYNAIMDRGNNQLYWGKLAIIGLVVGIFIGLNVFENTTTQEGCDGIPKIIVNNSLDMKVYFIVFLMLFVIYKDNYYISTVSFSLLFAVFIDNISRLGMESNIKTK